MPAMPRSGAHAAHHPVLDGGSVRLNLFQRRGSGGAGGDLTFVFAFLKSGYLIHEGNMKLCPVRRSRASRRERYLASSHMRRRINRVLEILAAHGFDSLVLGAWGCGAFHNDPVRTARDFRDALAGSFSGVFADVVLAIADWSPDRRFLGPFRDAFSA